MTDDDLQALPSLGPVSAAWLREAGIRTVAELRRVGAVEAYGRVTFRVGRAATRNLLYALEAALTGRRYHELTEPEKRRLCRAAGLAPPAPRRAPR